MLNNRLLHLHLVELIERLTLRKPEVQGTDLKDKLAELRNQIDKIDDCCIPENG